jgi:zinc transport system substrate-binding protein
VAGEGLEANQLFENGNQRQDPHVWLSPLLAKLMIDRIARGLSSVDSFNQQYYLARAETLKTKLNELDSLYRLGLAKCATRDIITSHEAFGYLAASYGLKQVAITGLSPDAEPSPRQMTEIASFAKQNNIKYIFFESLVSPKLAETIANEIGAQTLVLNPIEGLTKGEQSQGKDYFILMKENLANLEKALQCQ